MTPDIAYGKTFLDVIDKTNYRCELYRGVFLSAGSYNFDADAVVVSDTAQSASFIDMDGGVFGINGLMNDTVAIYDKLGSGMTESVIPALHHCSCISRSGSFGRVNDQVGDLLSARANASAQRTVCEYSGSDEVLRRITSSQSTSKIGVNSCTQLRIDRSGIDRHGPVIALCDLSSTFHTLA